MHAVRQQILEILKEREGATVAELAQSLDMAPVSVRHHLDILQGENLICVAKVARKGNVGRPQQVYGLTAQADEHFPDNFATLSSILVRQLKDVLPPEQLRIAFCSMANEIAAELRAVDSSEESMADHLDRVVDFLNERGYLARWEFTNEEGIEEGFLLHKHNCPYAGVSDEHPELCVMDQVLVDELIGCPCKRTHSINENGHCCTYHIPLVQMIPGERQVSAEYTMNLISPGS